MAATPEGKVKAAIDRLLAKFGAYVYAPTTGGYGRSGGFDRFVVYNGVPIGIEAKSDAATMPTRLQTENALRCYSNGGAVLCIHKDNIKALETYLLVVDEHGRRAVRTFVWPDKAVDDYNKAREQ